MLFTLRREKLAHEKKIRYSETYSSFFDILLQFSRIGVGDLKKKIHYDTNFRISSSELDRDKGYFPLFSVLFALCHLEKKRVPYSLYIVTNAWCMLALFTINLSERLDFNNFV